MDNENTSSSQTGAPLPCEVTIYDEAILDAALGSSAPAPVPVPQRLCVIEQVLDGRVIDLIKACPTNDVYRAHVLARIKVPLPVQATTYEQIKEWIEANVRPTAPPPQDPANPQSTAPEANVALSVLARYSYIESGTCSYTESYAGTGSYDLSVEDLRNMIGIVLDRGDDWEGLLAMVRDNIRDQCYDDPPDAESQGDIDHHNYDSAERSDSTCEVNRQETARVLRQAVQQLFPEAWGRLPGRPT